MGSALSFFVRGPMRHDLPDTHLTLGADLRALRRARVAAEISGIVRGCALAHRWTRAGANGAGDGAFCWMA